ncbi:hypothetical protein [Daejeonella sp.]|uniref:hypothetical protein n=1 Tax=Daejeonella sp. TaxID=2805397 RepID=UPI003983426B
MKKLINNTLIICFVAVFAACSPKTTTTTPTVSRGDVSGTWKVTSVNMEGFPAGTSAGKVFDMANAQDFQGSTWDLRGGGTGSISLTNGAVQPIYWSVNKTMAVPTFQFKKLMDGQRAKDVETGYSLQFGDVSGGTAVFKTPVMLSSGQTAYINLTFAKQ